MKIYISSTYRDLADYRAAVDRTLRRMGHDVIGMEQYVAEGSKPLDRCLADVQVADAYVIIVAWAYGYVPGAKQTPPDLRSITELELAQAESSKRPVLAFLLHPEAPWPPNRIDAMNADTGSGQAVARLRAHLGTKYLAGIFHTPDDLASQVAAAVSAQGLTRHIVDRVLGQTSIASNEVEPFANGQEVNSSTLMGIQGIIAQASAARALILEIDNGNRWWSTRLYLLASLLRTLTTVRQVVFTIANGRFIGMATPSAIVDGLASHFPELAEFGRQLGRDAASRDIERETERQSQTWTRFINQAAPNSADAAPAYGVATQYGLVPATREQAIKVGVRPPLLAEWLGERWVSRCIRVDAGDLAMTQVQQIVDSLLPEVPVERRLAPPSDQYELMVVDRDAFALELAREWVRSGLPRAPIH